MLKMAVIGKDVSKSDSAKMHTFDMKKLGSECSYELISIPREELDATVKKLIAGYDAFNVTIPYKLDVIPYLREIVGDAETFGAVNLVKDRVGYNTDGAGFMLMLEVEGIDPASAEFKQYGRDVAMQVAAAAPVAANREAVDPAVVEHEKAIYMAQAAESGKPEAIQEKMATGRLEKFFKENTLTEQAFVKNPDQSVAAYTAEVAKSLGGTIAIVDFKRFVLGE